MSEHKYSYQQLFDFTKAILQKIGCSEDHAATSAKVLLSADCVVLILMAWQD